MGPAVIPFDDREVAAEALSRQAAGREMMLGGPAPGRGPRPDPEDS